MSLYTVHPIEIVIDHEQYLLNIDNDEEGQLSFRLQYLKGGYDYEFTCFNQKEADIITEPAGITLKVQQLGHFLKRVLTGRMPSRSAYYEVYFCKEDYIDYKLFLQYGTKLPQKDANFLIFHIIDKSHTTSKIHFMIPFKRVEAGSSSYPKNHQSSSSSQKLFSERVQSNRIQSGDDFPDDVSELSIGPFENELTTNRRDPEAQAAIKKLNKRIKYLEKRHDTTQQLVDQQQESIKKLTKWNESLISRIHDQSSTISKYDHRIKKLSKNFKKMSSFMKSLAVKIDSIPLHDDSLTSYLYDSDNPDDDDDEEDIENNINDSLDIHDTVYQKQNPSMHKKKIQRKTKEEDHEEVNIEVIDPEKSMDIKTSFPETVVLYREHWKKFLIERTHIDEWNCIYRATRDGWLARNFHSLVDHKGPTLTLIRTTHSAVFGGYSSVSWRSPSFGELSHNDRQAFLFSFRRRLSGDETPILLKAKEGGAQVRHASESLVAFGTQDLVVASSSNSGNMQSLSRLSGEFVLEDGSAAPPYLLCDAQQFVVSDIEVYIPV